MPGFKSKIVKVPERKKGHIKDIFKNGKNANSL